MKKNKLWLCFVALFTALALSLDFQIRMVNDQNDVTLITHLANLFYGVSWAITLRQPWQCLYAAGAYWLYQRFLFQKTSRDAGIKGLAMVFSVLMLGTKLVLEHDTIAIGFSNRTQIIKSMIYTAGVFPLWLCVIRAVSRALAQPQQSFVFAHPLRTPFVILLAVWLPQALIRFPGAMSSDTISQLHAFYSGDFSRLYPAVYTVLVGALFRLGEQFGNPFAGMFLLTLGQVVALAAVLAMAMALLQRLRASRIVVLGVLGLYLLMPVYACYVTSLMYDVLYAIALLLFVVQTARWAFVPEDFFAHAWRHVALWMLGAAAAVVMHFSGVFVVVSTVAAAGVYHVCKSAHGRRWLLLCAGTVAVTLALSVQGAVMQHYHAEPPAMVEALSLPLQQTARVFSLRGASEAEMTVIDRVVDVSRLAQAYQPAMAYEINPLWREDASVQNVLAYLRVWLGQLAEHPVDCADATLHMMYGMLTPLKLDVRLFPLKVHGVLNGWELKALQPQGVLSQLADLLFRCYGVVVGIPVVGLFTNPGFYTNAAAILMLLTVRRRTWVAWLPVALCVITAILAAACSARYALPLMYTLPVVAALHATTPQKRV